MSGNILVLPLALLSVITGGVIYYSLTHVETVSSADVDKLPNGSYFAFTEKNSDRKYNATIFVKTSNVGHGTFQVDGTIEDVTGPRAGQLWKFRSTDQLCKDASFQLLYNGNSAEVVFEPFGSINESCKLGKLLNNGQRLVQLTE
ncbi:hypothetical protein QEL91_004138 [Pseudomonas putida]|nr:hypothetical protein [Pseudomonas putida]